MLTQDRRELSRTSGARDSSTQGIGPWVELSRAPEVRDVPGANRDWDGSSENNHERRRICANDERFVVSFLRAGHTLAAAFGCACRY